MRASLGLILAGLALAAALSGCAAQPMSDRLPSEMGGLPSNTPARPKSPYQYPAVHDMPPPRSTQPMTEEEQVRLEKELQAARERQERLTGTGKPDAPANTAAPATRAKASTVVVAPPPGVRASAPAPKKKPTTVIVVPPAGVTANP
jgi:hypothetical protein